VSGQDELVNSKNEERWQFLKNESKQRGMERRACQTLVYEYQQRLPPRKNLSREKSRTGTSLSHGLASARGFRVD
jgi:hypothetical protein